jgi:hypothetical protein
MEMDEYLLEIDRMINEGLGGGYIHEEYQWKQFDLSETPSSIKESKKGE